MLEKCAACNARILAGGAQFHSWRFCNDNCVTNFKAALVDRFVPPQVIASQVQAVVEAPCPVCKRQTGNDLYSSTRVTGMLVALMVNSGSRVSCVSCARKERLFASLHCLFLGWWSPKALFCNFFVLPTNLLASILTKQPTAPSGALVRQVKSRMADAVMPQIIDHLEQQRAAELAIQRAGDRDMPSWVPNDNA